MDQARKETREIPFISIQASDQQLNCLDPFQPSVLGRFPFWDKAATPALSSHGGYRFPFLAEGLFPFLVYRPGVRLEVVMTPSDI